MNQNQSGATDGTIEIIEIELFTREDKTPPEGKHYKVVIDGKHYVFKHHLVKGKELQERAGKVPIECYKLFEKRKHCEYELIKPEQEVNLIRHGVEHFKTEHSDEFCFRLDDNRYKTRHHELTPDEMLAEAKLNPADYYLIWVKPDGSTESFQNRGNTKIKMQCPCLQFTLVWTGTSGLS